MANYPTSQYGAASASGSGGGGAGGGLVPFRNVPGNTGCLVSIVTKDVCNFDSEDGTPLLTFAPAEVLMSYPDHWRYDPGGGAIDVDIESIEVARLGAGPGGGGEAAIVPITDLTQISFTSADPCADVGVLGLEVYAWSVGGDSRLLGVVQVNVTDDACVICGGP